MNPLTLSERGAVRLALVLGALVLVLVMVGTLRAPQSQAAPKVEIGTALVCEPDGCHEQP